MGFGLGFSYALCGYGVYGISAMRIERSSERRVRERLMI